MTETTVSITSKVWSFCNPLRDVGVGYGDYFEQWVYDYRTNIHHTLKKNPLKEAGLESFREIMATLNAK